MRLKNLTPVLALPVTGLLVVPLLAAVPAAATDVRPDATVALSWDFDGDGVLDLAGGQPGHEEGGPGQVLVRRGTGDGYGAPTVLKHPVQTEGNDAFGASLASEDLDRDGYADLVVGAPTSYGTPGAHGSVTVFRGSAVGLTQAGATTVAWPSRPDDPTAFGRSLALADLNGDGWTDIAVGAPDDDGDNGPDHSRLHVLRGGPLGYSTGRSYSVMPPSGTRWFGEVLAVGDVDQDGHPDLVESGTYPTKGSHLSFLRGTDTGPHRARLFSTGWAQSLAVGDVTGDGYDDVVAGRPFGRYDNNSRKPYVGAGRVTLFRGSASGLAATGVTVTPESRGVPGSSQYRDFFGASVALADVNDNGRREVVVGVPGRDVGTVKDAGAVVVLRVGPTGFRRTGNRAVTQATAGVAGDPRRAGNFGSAVAVQDRTRDGVPDLLVRSRGRYDEPGILTVLRVLDAPLLAGGTTAEPVLDGTLPRGGSSS